MVVHDRLGNVLEWRVFGTWKKSYVLCLKLCFKDLWNCCVNSRTSSIWWHHRKVYCMVFFPSWAFWGEFSRDFARARLRIWIQIAKCKLKGLNSMTLWRIIDGPYHPVTHIGFTLVNSVELFLIFSGACVRRIRLTEFASIFSFLCWKTAL